MHTRTIILSILCAASTATIAQDGIHMPVPYEQLSIDEKKQLKTQAWSIFNAFTPAIKNASKSAVSIHTHGRRVAFGTAILDNNSQPAVLTKWSEVANTHSGLYVLAQDGKAYPATVTGVYPEHDLAILQSNAPLKPINLQQPANTTLGSFLALARPDGKAEGVGVISVLPRSLREKDKAYLGVEMSFKQSGKNGVHLRKVMPESAAHRAGLRAGDVIISIDQENITGAMQMRNLLQKLEPGANVPLVYQRQQSTLETNVQLGSRADNKIIQRVPAKRMERMQRMGTTLSNVRKNFPRVIQSDMPIDPNDTGAPVTDLDGNFIGITIARGSRIKTFITPADTLRQLLKADPVPLRQALAAQPQPHANQQNRTPQYSRSQIQRLFTEIEKNNQINQQLMREIRKQLHQEHPRQR